MTVAPTMMKTKAGTVLESNEELKRIRARTHFRDIPDDSLREPHWLDPHVWASQKKPSDEACRTLKQPGTSSRLRGGMEEEDSYEEQHGTRHGQLTGHSHGLQESGTGNHCPSVLVAGQQHPRLRQAQQSVQQSLQPPKATGGKMLGSTKKENGTTNTYRRRGAEFSAYLVEEEQDRDRR